MRKVVAIAHGPPQGYSNLALPQELVAVSRHTAEELMRFRDGRAEAVVPVRFVPLVPDPGDPSEGGAAPDA